MSDIMWNKGQLEAINAEGSSTLVSAAAGSGKTAVLVERIIRKLTQKDNPCNIEDFLIVTFTRAAASQMKDKISSALSAKIAQEPENRHLRECKFKLPFSNISTIDSFCIGLVRDNFNSAGVSPDFVILDEAKNNILKRNAVEKVIEEFHIKYPEEFSYLNETINNNKNDKETQESIMTLYKESTAYAFPEDYFDSLLKLYEDDSALSESKAGKLIFSETEKRLNRYLSEIKIMRSAIESDITGVREKYSDKLDNDDREIKILLQAVKEGDWDGIKAAIDRAQFDSNRGARNLDPVLNGYIKDGRNSYIDAVKKEKLFYYNYSSEDYETAKKRILPAAKTLTAAVKRYGEILFELKQEENAYSYNDIMHLTVNLLLKKENGKTVKTQTAEELSSRYKEILVDEYQDVNAAQDSIFEALSDNDKNRFLVGDVKQCIYAFRQAMPEIFTSLRDEAPGINKVYLNSNYRSRREITETVNFIFRQIMSKETGDVDYDENEYLNPGAPYSSDGKTKIEFNIISAGDSEKEKLRNQAYFVADRIIKSIREKEQIVEKANSDAPDTMRDIKLSDYCILYRNKKCGKIFGEVFDEIGIPYISDNEDSFIASPEISFIKALLKTVDNPTDDVSLAAVMLSPVFGFTPDELTLIRSRGGRGSFYKCVSTDAAAGNLKSADFIDKIGKLRRISATRSAGEFTADIIDEIGYRAIVSKMKNPSSRLTNINSFINLANSFEQSGAKGISAFVRFFSKLNNDDVRVSSSASSSGTDCVRMMTIHKSKGLEFPAVILPNTERNFNFSDVSSNLIISKNYGIGMKYIKDNVRYDNIFRKICAEDKKRNQISEELRLIYVALTRAKEKIMILASDSAALGKMKGIMPGDDKIDADITAGMNNSLTLIGSALLSHPDAHILRNMSGGNYDYHSHCETGIDFKIIDTVSAPETICINDEISQDIPDTVSSEKLKREINDRLSYRYPYEMLNKIRAKSTASNLSGKTFNKRYFAVSKPQFAMDGRLTGAQIGTATHRFMQYCNLKKAKTDIESEMNRLLNEGIINEKEFNSLSREKISGFFKSAIFERLINSEKIYREFSFNASLPVAEIYPESESAETRDETILIEGVVDCAFEENGNLIIIDFKTDNVTDETELISEYRAQLETYKKCLSKVLNISVSETLIYSFSLNKIISL